MKKKYERLNKNLVLRIRNLTENGQSLRKIKELTGINLTTIYYQVRKIKPKQKKKFIVNLNEFQIGELIGAFAGDGSYYYSLNEKGNLNRGGQYRVRFHLSLSDDMNYAKYLKSLLLKTNLNPHLFIRKDNNVVDVAVSSKDFIEFIKKYLKWHESKTYSVRLKENVSNYSNKFLRGFARGLMDTDGYVEISNVSITCISEQLIKNLKFIFDKFSIKYKFSIRKHQDNRKDGHLVRVYASSLKDFNKMIGFSNLYKQEKLDRLLMNRKS